MKNVFVEQRELFAAKALLRRVYREDFFPRLRAETLLGSTLEIGSGPGLLQRDWPEIVASDITRSPGLNTVLDACRLPWKTSSWTNVVGLDVLHHLPSPLDFLQETERVLKPGGRLVLIEPWLTPFSRFIYRHFHQEDCDETVDTAHPFSGPSSRDKKPMEGNQAIPYLLFGPNRQTHSIKVPSLRMIKCEPFSGVAYLLSLGFRRGTLAPGWSYPVLHRLEEWTGALWKHWGALRALIVLENSMVSE